MKNSKILFFILGALVFSLSACNASNENSGGSNDPTSSHEHTYSSSWNCDNTCHWHDATCGHDVVSSKETHTFNDVVTPASYSAGGYTTHTCTVCGYSYTDSQTDQLVHHYESGWSHNESTHWHTCIDIGYEDLKSEEAAHSFEEVVTPASYSAGGYTTHTCTICGYSYNDNLTDRLTYLITWRNWDNSLLRTDRCYEGSIPSYDSTPTKEHDGKYYYVFLGWSPSVVAAYSDATYVAQFSQHERTSFEVKYNANGGSNAPSSQTKQKDVPLTLPSTRPIKEDMSFIGWNNIYENTIYQPGDDFNLDMDVTLWAMWEKICPNCDGAGKVGSTDWCANCQGTGKRNHYSTCTGCKGSGYFYTYSCNKCGYTTGQTTSSTPPQYICPMCRNGNMVTASRETCPICSGQGKTYEGYFTCETCNGRGYFGEITTCSLCHGTKYIKLDAPTLISVEYNQIKVVEEAGYEYSIDGTNFQSSGVFNNLHSSTTYSIYRRVATHGDHPFSGISYPLVVTTGSVETYTISYDLDGGTDNSSNPTNYTIESESITLIAPTKTGYKFIGWTGSNGSTPQVEVVIPKQSTGNLSYKANWTIVPYNITYELFGGTNALKNPSTYTIEDNVELKDAKKDFYTFEGWYLDSSFTQKITNIKGHHENLTVYAHFIPYSYNATFNANGGHFTYNIRLVWGEDIEDQVFTYDAGKTFYPYEYEIPSRKNLLFNGWYLDSEYKTPLPTDYEVTSDVTLYAKWLSNNGRATLLSSERTFSCTVSGFGGGEFYNFYVTHEHSGPATISYKAQGSYTNVYTGTTYYARVWMNDLFIAEANTSTSTGSITLDLEEGHVYTIRMQPMGGGTCSATISLNTKSLKSHVCTTSSTAVSTENYEEQTSYTVPTYDGYDFDGWYDENDILMDEQWNYTEDKSFTARWRLHNYKIDYTLYGGTNNPLNPNSFTINDADFTLLEPTREGYTFEGWYSDELYHNPVTVINTSVHQDYHLYAKWVSDYFTIDYVLNGGVNNPSNISSIGRNEDFTLLEPTKDGYTFNGWYLEPSFTTNVTEIHGSSRKNYTLYAKWTPNQYTATLDYNGGELCPVVNYYSNGALIKSVDAFDGSTIDYFVPEAPSSNRKFAGWYYDSSFTNPFNSDATITQNTNLYAKWIDIGGYECQELGSSFNVAIAGASYQYIAVISPITQTVTIESQTDLDVYGAIYNSNWTTIASSDDISDDNLNFSMTVTLQAGQVYYIGVRGNQALTTGDCTVVLSGVNTISPQLTGNAFAPIETVAVTYDAVYSLPTPKRDGYIFVGWFDENGNPIDTSSWSYAESITIYAHWIPAN